MRITLSLVTLLFLSPLLNAQQQSNPPHLLVRTLCQAGNECGTINALASRTVPFLGTKSVEGVLNVDGSDPLAPCVEKIDSMKDTEAASCVKNHLAGNAVRDALKNEKYDGYLIYILRWDLRGGNYGRAVLLTPSGERVDSYASINQLRPDLTPLGIGVLPVEQQALIVQLPDLATQASRAGLQGIPPHHVVLRRQNDGAGDGLYGTVFVPPPQQ